MWGRVTTEVADTGGVGPDCRYEISGRRELLVVGPLLVLPVLTIEAVEGTAVVEHGEVMAGSGFPLAADLVGHAVRGERVPVPVNRCGFRVASDDRFSVVSSDSAEADVSGDNPAAVLAPCAEDAGGVLGGLLGQSKTAPQSYPARVVDRARDPGLVHDALTAHPQGLRD